MQDATHDLSRYAAMVKALAQHAIEIAVDATAHRTAEGQTVMSLIHLLPVARQLLGDPVDFGEIERRLRDTVERVRGPEPFESPATSRVKFTDGRGHHRVVYSFLAQDIYVQARGKDYFLPLNAQRTDLLAFDDAYPAEMSDVSDRQPDVSLMLWWFLSCHRLPGSRPARPEQHLRWIGLPGSDRPLHDQQLDDSPDEWTYRELVGLHALDHLVHLTGHEPWRQRVLEVTAYHQYHTQPDYTTYQPWGLAAFLSNPETVMFGEQQLHDVQTHLQIEGGPGAVLPALLLADAYASLDSMSRP